MTPVELYTLWDAFGPIALLLAASVFLLRIRALS
jgi:hypothetical protein